MSFDIVKTVDFPQAAFQYVPQEILGGNAIEEFATLGGILSDLKHLWNAKGPCLEVRNILSGRKVGSWTFGGILKDANTKIVAVDELKRPHGRLPLLVVALDCTISGGLVCVFDIFGSKVLRVVQVREQITSLHVIDSGCENSVLPEPSSLRYFDGIAAVGSLGGNVYLLDMCRQICENAIQNVDSTIRDELSPCPMVILQKEKIDNIKKYVERSVDREEHLAIHINIVLNPSTEHFTLKGENGEDRVHVNRSETEVSSLFYSPQIASLLVGYNFGAFQLWDLRLLNLAYTSPICEEHIPVMHFTVQEPADDPKAYCYIWVSYSHNLKFHSGLPFAVMYSFYYENKNYVNGYGTLYEDFQHCSVRFQIELGDTETPTYNSRGKGGMCIGLQSLNKYPINKDLNSMSLCLISWLVWNSQKEIDTSVLVFDLNQWYKEQMPRAPIWSDCSNYIIKNSLKEEVLDVKLDYKSLSQFIGIQRLEEHFCPTSLSFDLWCITDNGTLKVHNKGLQKAFIDKIVADQHLSLVRPEDYFDQITSLGLVPLFCEIHLSSSLDVDRQREILLDVALEQKLVGWLCKSTSKLANNAFNASGLTIYNILNWAFERAITLKKACEKYCVPLFDHSGTRLDNNTVALLSSSTGQIRNICSLYRYVSSKLIRFIADKEALSEEQRSLENVVVYLEVLLWMVNIGLLPECPLMNYRSHDDSVMSAPYLVNDLTRYYDGKRAQLQMASHETFVEKDCLLFVDNLISVRGGAEILRGQWQKDGGSGLYPPPSLQSVLRTYILDGPDLVFKHSLVTYTLLDIAMAVDENNKVIKLLLKFPQIFDLSQSNIKIVQAFWHLDHDDYETALEYILDPCVLTEDLQHWHHSVMMRSLLLQDKSSLALLYLQIRKPSIQDDKDLLTVISLLISKNMLDEAFTFRQRRENPNERALLLHIFNECNKNELLHSLLYRRLDNGEEKAFFKYLQNTKNPRCEDLKVFYYLLRSRFLEAFDSYSSIKRSKPENQGLIGQRDATTADNIVKMFRTLLPEVNKNLVELVRKERTNLWKEVKKPTPLSVFVHNARDHVQYKSSVIFASLAKAKQTFNDTLNDTGVNNDVVTEETPFLRTPTVFRQVSGIGTPLLKSRVIEQNEQGEEYGPSPCKKLKLSPRMSKTSPVKSRNLSLSTIQSKLSTPIIRRKRMSTEPSTSTSILPQSILKGSSATRTLLDDSIFNANTSVNTSLQLECENSVRRSRLALSPRKSVSRTPSHVKFDDLRYSNSSNEQNSKNESSLLNLIPETSRGQSANSTASTVDEIFYSPDHSPDASEDDVEKTAPESVKEKIKKTSLSPVREKLSFDDTLTGNDVFMEEQPKKEREASRIPVEDDDLSTNRLTFQSPRSRRSYKRSFGESPVPVRSSPRLAKKASQEEEASPETTVNKSESLLKPSPSVAVQKLRGRKSLSRAVLEHNTFSRVTSRNVFEENESDISSLNTTNDSDSEIDTEDSHDDSLERLLEKYRTSALGSVSINDSLLSNSEKNIDGDGEVVSKTMEMRTIETHRESVIKSNTQELVSSKETREEYRLRKVEEFGVEENSIDSNIFTETTQPFNANIGKNVESTVEEDNRSEAEASGSSGNKKSLNQNETQEQAEGINIYEDLSSGSEDVREVLQRYKKKEDDDKEYTDISFSTSLSYYQNERKDERMPDNFLDSEESNSNDGASKLPKPEPDYDNDVDMEELYDDIPATEQAFIESGEVIEIGSSSDEDDNRKEIKQETDESSPSCSSSTSEDKSDSASDESSENYEMNVGFESNLNETAGQRGKIDESRSTEEERSINEEERTTGSDKDIEQNRQTEHNSNKVLETEETENKAALEESTDSLLDDSTTSTNMERRFELDQIEIEAAVKGLQADNEEQQVVAADDEHMDSLILEQSPEEDIEDPLKITQLGDHNENERIAVNETQKVIESDLKEGKKAIVETAELVASQPSVSEDNKEPEKLEADENIQAKLAEEDDEASTTNIKELKTSISSRKHARGLQCTLGVNDSTMGSSQEKIVELEVDSVASENGTKTSSLTEVETPASVLKQSKSVQCTLGAIMEDTIMESLVADDTSVFQKDDENLVLNKNQVASENDGTSSFPKKQSKSLQCTLGANDSIMEAAVADTSVFLKDNENEDVKKASVYPTKESKSLQCTLGANDSIMESSVDDSSIFLKDDENTEQNNDGIISENKTEAFTEKGTSVSMDIDSRTQCTLGTGDLIEDCVSVSLMEEPLNEDATLVLKTVKKTYTGRKTAESPETVALDATPKLTVSVTKRTYSKKDLDKSDKLSKITSDVASTPQAGTQEVEEDTQKNDKSENEKEGTGQSKKEAAEPMDVGDQSQELDDTETTKKESVVKETPDSTQETPPKKQNLKEYAIRNEANTEEPDKSKTKNVEATRPTSSMRVTRRRSVLLSQQEGTPSSTSEKSVTSSTSGHRLRSKEAKDESSDSPLGDSSSQASTSRTTPSQFTDSMFDASFVIGSPVVRAEIDIMETSIIDRNFAVRVERGVLETDEEMGEKKSPEAKAGPLKIRSRRSSKNSSKNEFSASLKQALYAIPSGQPMKRTRSASVDQPVASIRKRSIRSKSIDLDDLEGPAANRKMDLQVVLTPITEQAGSSTEKDSSEHEALKPSTKAYSDVGAYTTSRRLTRRQASMLKSIEKVKKEVKKLEEMKEIDALHLLDKSEFSDKADLDESKVYEQSSPSTNSSEPPSRHTRSTSVASDVPGTPTKKKAKAKSEHVDSPISGIKTRLRRQSTDTMSVASEQSDSPSPSKRAKKKDSESEADKDSPPVKGAKKGRSRASSVSSTKSVASDKTESSVRATRSRRIPSAKSELPEIKEEKGGDEGEIDTSVMKKRGRKKKI